MPPAARIAHKFGPDLSAGFEYYADFGRIGDFKPVDQQQHPLFAVTDFKLAEFDVNFGVGYGLTPASDCWVAEAIIGYALPVASRHETERATAGPVDPMSHASSRLQ